MSLNLPTRPIDRKRAVKAMTAVFTNDENALLEVLAEIATEQYAGTGAFLAALQYADWLTRNTPPLPGEPDPWNDQPDDGQPTDDQ